MRDFTAIKGAAFGPVKFELSTSDRSAVTISSAIVRLSRTGVGVRDSTVALGEVIVDDSNDIVTWTLPMAVTATLTQPDYDVELILVDASGQQRIPSGDGTARLVMRARASAPAG